MSEQNLAKRCLAGDAAEGPSPSTQRPRSPEGSGGAKRYHSPGAPNGRCYSLADHAGALAVILGEEFDAPFLFQDARTGEPLSLRAGGSAQGVLEPRLVGEVASGTVTDPATKAQIDVDVAVLGPGRPGEPRQVISIGEAKWGKVMTLRHLERLRRARALLAVKGYGTAGTTLACYSGAGFDPALQADLLLEQAAAHFAAAPPIERLEIAHRGQLRRPGGSCQSGVRL